MIFSLKNKQAGNSPPPPSEKKINIVKSVRSRKHSGATDAAWSAGKRRRKNREICPWQTQMVTKRGRREQVKCKKKQKTKKQKSQGTLRFLDEVEKAKRATLLHLRPHLHINELISKHVSSSALLQKLPSIQEQWKCSQTRHLPQTRSLYLHAACGRDRFQVEVEKWKWSRELSIPPEPPPSCRSATSF